MFSLLMPLLMPILVTATITIDIKAADTYSGTRVNMSGYSKSLVTETDRHIFQIGDRELKQAILMYAGGMPDNVYVKSPTPWGDLYSTWKWPQINRIITPKYAKILDITSEPVVVAKKIFKNNSKYPSQHDSNFSQQADMTVKSSWARGVSYTFGEQISYSVSIGSDNIGKSRKVFYNNLFGDELSTTSGVSIGSNLSYQLNLQPGQEVEAVLRATQAVVRVEVTYEAKLDGTVATNYAGMFKGHHFWGYSVNTCLEMVGKPRKINFKEELEIKFYFDEHVTSS